MTKISLPKAISVKKIILENFRTKTFICEEKIVAKPGQFIMVWLPGVAEKPFSITENNPLTFTVMEVGNFTKTINKTVKEGNKIWYRGPFGRGIFKKVKGKKILISGGCGCAPLYFLAKQLKDNENTLVIVGAKKRKELLFVEKFKSLKFKVNITTDDGSVGFKGFATTLLEKILREEKIACVYGCGPEMMLAKIVKLCDKFKTKYQLSLEALMKCGFGICGSCSRGDKLVCKDGPVFKNEFSRKI